MLCSSASSAVVTVGLGMPAVPRGPFPSGAAGSSGDDGMSNAVLTSGFASEGELDSDGSGATSGLRRASDGPAAASLSDDSPAGGLIAAGLAAAAADATGPFVAAGGGCGAPTAPPRLAACLLG